MTETPPRVELPDQEPELNEDAARLLLCMLLALHARPGTPHSDTEAPGGEGLYLRETGSDAERR